MKIIDCTLFSEDFLALLIRINELKHVVDHFLVCESNFSFSGKPKPLYLSENIDQFDEFKDRIKIVAYIVDKPHRNPWIQEMRQRQFLNEEIISVARNRSDLIHYSDCDEIPSADLLLELSKGDANHLLSLRNFTSFINLSCGEWARGRLISRKYFKSVGHLRRDIYVYQQWRSRTSYLPIIKVPPWFSPRQRELPWPHVVFKKPPLTVAKDAGWHFNNLFRSETLARKVMFSSHVDVSENLTLDTMLNRIHALKDVYGKTSGTKVELNSSFPKFILDNRERFQEYIL